MSAIEGRKSPSSLPPSLVGPGALTVSYFSGILVSRCLGVCTLTWCVMGYGMPRMEERINLRLSSEVYKPYVRLAQAITGMGHPMTATQLVRMLVEAQVEQTEMLCTYAEAALRGDVEARDAVFDAVLAWNESLINTARTVEHAERRGAAAAPAST